MRNLIIAGLVACTVALTGCVSIEGTKAQLASNDPAQRNEARQIVMDKLTDLRLSTQERLQWLELVTDNAMLYDAYAKLKELGYSGHVEIRNAVIRKMDLSTKADAIKFIKWGMTSRDASNDAVVREKAKSGFKSLGELEIVDILFSDTFYIYCDTVGRDLSQYLANTAELPEVLCRILTEKDARPYRGIFNLEEELKAQIEARLLEKTDKLSTESAGKLLTFYGNEFKYLTNDDLIGKLIAKLPRDKQKKPQNILNSRRAKKPCVVDGIDWCGLFDIVDGEAVIEKNWALKEDHFPSHLTIPSSLAGFPVTRIAKGAFQAFKLTSVVIPDSVRDIDEHAFGDFYSSSDSPCHKSLEHVVIGTGVTNVAEGAFRHCVNLTNVTIRSGNKGLAFGKEAFKGCKKLKPIGGTWRFYPESTFEECDSYHDENGFRIIGRFLESYQGNATSVVIPDGVTDICQFAFNGNKRLKVITIPEGVKRIGSAAFGGCTALREVVVPQSVEKIEENAFWGCLLLERFILKSDDTTIEGNAFHKCRNLHWVETPTKKLPPMTWLDRDALTDREVNRFRLDNPVIY